MTGFTRTDTSLVARWWWTVDRWMLAALALLIGVGAVMVLAASPAVAERLDLDGFYFVRRHLLLLGPALAVMLAASLLSPTGVRRLAVILLAAGLVLMVATLLVGEDVKGARRWLSIAGLSVQPSEIVRPGFVVVAAWLFATRRQYPRFPGDALATVLLGLVLLLLVLQPDFGMAFTLAGVWLAEFFVAGLPMIWIGGLLALGVGGLVAGYVGLDHVHSRVDRFLDPAAGDTYQVDTSLRAFASGGLLGRGPGEGVVKGQLPDAHADFIFAVIGEEFGLIACLVLVGLFAFVVLRGFARLMREEDLFAVIAGAGLLSLFGLQALLNMAVTLRLVPTKGMTLPFVSYGGSSLIALAAGMGMMLALTRWRPRPEAGR
ncbi:MAG TPA: putative lipid II flippase FtsW [Alphaproteobacteria bacterium]